MALLYAPWAAAQLVHQSAYERDERKICQSRRGRPVLQCRRQLEYVRDMTKRALWWQTASTVQIVNVSRLHAAFSALARIERAPSARCAAHQGPSPHAENLARRTRAPKPRALLVWKTRAHRRATLWTLSN